VCSEVEAGLLAQRGMIANIGKWSGGVVIMPMGITDFLSRNVRLNEAITLGQRRGRRHHRQMRACTDAWPGAERQIGKTIVSGARWSRRFSVPRFFDGARGLGVRELSQSLSVWTCLGALYAYAYDGLHGDVVKVSRTKFPHRISCRRVVGCRWCQSYMDGGRRASALPV
jgi:hypothetical protein